VDGPWLATAENSGPVEKPLRSARGGETPALGAGDTILARIAATGDKTYPYEARIIKQLKGPSGTVVGVFTALPRGGGQIMSANRKDKQGFDVLRGDEGDARSGDLVRAEITRQRGRGYAQARVVERLGKAEDQRNVSLIAIHQHGIPTSLAERCHAGCRTTGRVAAAKGAH
jgi:ribonuclease R